MYLYIALWTLYVCIFFRQPSYFVEFIQRPLVILGLLAGYGARPIGTCLGCDKNHSSGRFQTQNPWSFSCSNLKTRANIMYVIIMSSILSFLQFVFMLRLNPKPSINYFIMNLSQTLQDYECDSSIQEIKREFLPYVVDLSKSTPIYLLSLLQGFLPFLSRTLSQVSTKYLPLYLPLICYLKPIRCLITIN